MKELIAIQSELKAPKSQFNKFGGYKYRKAEDILEAVKPLLNKQKCTLTITDDIVMVGNRIYVKATATIKNEKGECETTTGWAREEETKKGMDGSQITGASSSYARKYALNGLFAIDDNADSDTTNDGQQQTQQQEQVKQATNSGGSQLHPDNLKEGLYYLNLSVNKDQLLWTVQTYQPLCSNAQFMQAVSAKKKQLGIQ
nr:MAG TPA: ERF superfamily protein [Caudoviricetes sp.]